MRNRSPRRDRGQRGLRRRSRPGALIVFTFFMVALGAAGAWIVIRGFPTNEEAKDPGTTSSSEVSGQPTENKLGDLAADPTRPSPDRLCPACEGEGQIKSPTDAEIQAFAAADVARDEERASALGFRWPEKFLREQLGAREDYYRRWRDRPARTERIVEEEARRAGVDPESLRNGMLALEPDAFSFGPCRWCGGDGILALKDSEPPFRGGFLSWVAWAEQKQHEESERSMEMWRAVFGQGGRR